jgi:hypothetical protein
MEMPGGGGQKLKERQNFKKMISCENRTIQVCEGINPTG